MEERCTTNCTEFEGDDFTTSSVPFKLVMGTLYLLIFLLGVFGNALVCFVVARNRQMQNVTNLFITNLALSDILLCVLAVPFTPLYTFLGSWVFGDLLCHMVPYSQGVSIYISTLTLTSIAVDRFLVILYPFRPRMKISTCLVIIVAVWVVALLLTFPYGWYMRPLSDQDDRFCEEAWPDEATRKTFSLVTSVLQFVVPFVAITVCYVCVFVRLSDRMKFKPGSKTGKKEEADRERAKKTNRMLIAMVAIFGISWLPLNMFNVAEDFYQSVMVWKFNRVLFFMVHCLAMSSTCYNPFLYAWLNENFRKEFKQVLPFFSQSPQHRANGLQAASRLERAGGGGGSGGGNLELQTAQKSLLPVYPEKKTLEVISLEPTNSGKEASS